MTKENGMPLEGEGSYVGGKKFQRDEREFIKTGAVKKKAREAAEAVDGPQAKELEEARIRTGKGQTRKQ